jgi:hypothetical protein
MFLACLVPPGRTAALFGLRLTTISRRGFYHSPAERVDNNETVVLVKQSCVEKRRLGWQIGCQPGGRDLRTISKKLSGRAAHQRMFNVNRTLLSDPLMRG